MSYSLWDVALSEGVVGFCTVRGCGVLEFLMGFGVLPSLRGLWGVALSGEFVVFNCLWGCGVLKCLRGCGFCSVWGCGMFHCLWGLWGVAQSEGMWSV